MKVFYLFSLCERSLVPCFEHHLIFAILPQVQDKSIFRSSTNMCGSCELAKESYRLLLSCVEEVHIPKPLS